MSDIAIKLNRVAKYYKLYHESKDRLKEALHPFGKKYHKQFYALNNICLEINKGEVIGIVGRNGSGKSTLLKLISGVLAPNAGTVQVNGKISALLELGAGFNPEFTGLQNIYFYSTILGLSIKEIDVKLDEILAFAEIGQFIDQPIKTYSSGMKARLGFAVAVHIDPEILILDEVLSVGDALFRRKCFTKMEEFFKGGKTIIYVSHDANSVNELCSRAIFLNSGEILLDGAAKEVTTFYQKFLFAENIDNDQLKQELNKHLEKRNVLANEFSEIKRQTAANIEGLAKDSSPSTLGKEYFIAEFVPKSTVKIQNYAVEIFAPSIKTLAGEQVNVLVMNHRYIYSFKVQFDIDASTVSFGSQIKSDKGLRISLASLQEANKQIKTITRGLYEIEWAFDCKVLPGIYYLDSSVTGMVDTEKKVLCRVMDIYVFKVLPVADSLYVGLVSLNQTIKYKKVLNESVHDHK